MVAAQFDEAEGLPDPMTGPDDPYDDDALAAEYVLHLLDDGERKAFEARMRDDPELRKAVHDWQSILVPMAEEFAAVEPPVHIKRAIMDRIAPETNRTRTGLWRWIAGLVAMGAAALIVFAMIGPVFRTPGALSPSFQAELSSADGTLVVTAGVIPATHEIVIDRSVGAARPGRVHELWLIAEGASAPVSLGILETEGTTRITVPDEIAPGVRTGTIAISDEPEGGSPTGSPTGAILATGTFNDL